MDIASTVPVKTADQCIESHFQVLLLDHVLKDFANVSLLKLVK